MSPSSAKRAFVFSLHVLLLILSLRVYILHILLVYIRNYRKGLQDLAIGLCPKVAVPKALESLDLCDSVLIRGCCSTASIHRGQVRTARIAGLFCLLSPENIRNGEAGVFPDLLPAGLLGTIPQDKSCS